MVNSLLLTSSLANKTKHFLWTSRKTATNHRLTKRITILYHTEMLQLQTLQICAMKWQYQTLVWVWHLHWWIYTYRPIWCPHSSSWKTSFVKDYQVPELLLQKLSCQFHLPGNVFFKRQTNDSRSGTVKVGENITHVTVKNVWLLCGMVYQLCGTASFIISLQAIDYCSLSRDNNWLIVSDILYFKVICTFWT